MMRDNEPHAPEGAAEHVKQIADKTTKLLESMSGGLFTLTAAVTKQHCELPLGVWRNRFAVEHTIFARKTSLTLDIGLCARRGKESGPNTGPARPGRS